MDEITLKDVCQYGQIDALSDAARDKMLKAPQTFQDFLNEALMEEYNPSLCRCAAGLKDNGFTKIEAIEVIRKTKGHREPVGNEIERAVDLIYGAASSEPVKKSPWSVFKTPIA